MTARSGTISEVERSAAMKGIMRWVRLHPYNISQKVQVVVEHFRENVQPLLDGHAKAMVVVGSRLEAVRWQLAIDKYIKSQGYKIATLVAFSGEVNDPESGPDPFTETSKSLEPEPARAAICGRPSTRTSIRSCWWRISSRPASISRCCAACMWTSGLAGIQAVQTLSRLNRSYSGPFGEKDTTYVLDFVNEPAEILLAFKTYYQTAELENVTDPNLVFNLRAKLDAAGHYDDFEVDRVVAVELNPKREAK